MTWQDAFKICATILASLGGGGAVVFGLSNFLGKLWADRALQDDRQRYKQLNLQLENELHNASRRLQAELDKFGLVNKLRIEGEFQRLTQLWKSFANLSFAFNGISPLGFKLLPADQADRKAYFESQRKEFAKSLNNAQQLFYEEMVFIPEPIVGFAKTTLEKALREPSIYAMFFDHYDPKIKGQYYEDFDKLLQGFMSGMSNLEASIRKHIEDRSQRALEPF